MGEGEDGWAPLRWGGETASGSVGLEEGIFESKILLLLGEGCRLGSQPLHGAWDLQLQAPVPTTAQPLIPLWALQSLFRTDPFTLITVGL